MLARTMTASFRFFYKRNSNLYLLRSLKYFSTNNKLNSMSEVNELAKKVEQVKIQQPLQTQEKVEAKTEVQGQVKVEEKSEAKVEQKPAKKEKKKKQEKPKAQKKEEGPAEDKDEVGPKLFSQIDIRVGEIVECWKHPQSENLYCQKIQVCGEVRQIASGLQKFVPLEQMKGKVIVMANLKPRPLAGFLSNGMVVCASNGDHTFVQLLIPEGQVGERVYLEGFEDLFIQGDIQPVLNPKKKVLQKSSEFFRTDEEGFVVWKGIRLRTKAGHIKAATVKNGHVS